MSNIADYKSNNPHSTAAFDDKLEDTTEKVRKFAKWLYEFRPILDKEFRSLEVLSKKSKNTVFPIKMGALSDIYRAAEPLYEWYCKRPR